MLPPIILFDLDDTILDDTGGASAAWEQACIDSGAPDGLYDAIRSAGAWFWSDADRHREGRADLGGARRDDRGHRARAASGCRTTGCRNASRRG